MIEVVDCATSVHVQVESKLTHLCPFKPEVDEGSVVVQWTTDEGKTIELHSLRAYFDSHANSAISHEELAEEVWQALEELPVSDVHVELSFATAGMAVEVSTG